MIRSAILLLALLAGCARHAEPLPERRPGAATATPSASATRTAAGSTDVPVAPLPPSTLPAPARLVAIGDVHGDLDAFRAALRLGGAIDTTDRWIGGALWVVQTGDVLDRGDDEDAILALIGRLEQESARAGGRFVALNGNHELMNAQGDFRYVTPDGFADFAPYAARVPERERDGVPVAARGRVGAFGPGGPVARTLASHATAVRIGDTVFVHGGVSPRHAERGLDTINGDVRAFLLGDAPLSAMTSAEDGPVWNRDYGRDEDDATCAALARSLELLQAKRMVVGHTVRPHGIDSACDGRVWRIDVGLSRAYGGPIEVLEIDGDDVRPLRAPR